MERIETKFLFVFFQVPLTNIRNLSVFYDAIYLAKPDTTITRLKQINFFQFKINQENRVN